LFENLPQVEDDGEKEDLDFENCAVLDIDMDKGSLEIAAGGDWQEPQTFTATWSKKGTLKVRNAHEGYDDQKMSWNKILETIYGDLKKAPKKLQYTDYR